MKCYAWSLFRHIHKQISEHLGKIGGSHKLLFVMPSVPPGVVVEFGEQLTNQEYQLEKGFETLIKIADSLFNEWESLSDPASRQHVALALSRGWRDTHGNLTGYRNEPVPDGVALCVVILIGSDRITDQSSLEDFYRCDATTIWRMEMEKDFIPWAVKSLVKAKIPYESDTLEHFNEVLQSLIEKGLADVLTISTLLDYLDLSGAMDGRDAERVLLDSLQPFGLPSLGGYRFGGRNKLAGYLDDGVAFFSYDMFLEALSRINSKKKIDQYMVEHPQEMEGLFEPDGKGDFINSTAVLEGVLSYIDQPDNQLKGRLLACDFVILRDKVLKYRPPKTSPPPKRPPKLSGSPIEVILTGIWRTLKIFKQTSEKNGEIADEAIAGIRVTATQFKHDQEGDTAEERSDEARKYLTRLLGGVSSWIEKYLDTEVFRGKEKPIKFETDLTPIGIDFQSAKTAEPFLEFCVEIDGHNWDEPIKQSFRWRMPELDDYRTADDLLVKTVGKMRDNQEYYLPVFLVPYYEELLRCRDEEESRRVLRIAIEKGAPCNLLPAITATPNETVWRSLQRLAITYKIFLQSIEQHGLYGVLLQPGWIDLRQAYEGACEKCLEQPNCGDSPAAAILHRAFLVIRERKSHVGDDWRWTPFEPSGVVTVLHPALLEMLQAQIQFLLTCFGTIAGRELRHSGGQSFQNGVWQRYLDLADLKMPLNGLIKNQDGILDTQVQGKNLIHRIGQQAKDTATLTTRLLLSYDDFNEDEISVEEMIRESRESLLISRILDDYCRLHPHAEDGLRLSFYRNQDIQPVIAAIDQFLRNRHEKHEPTQSIYGLFVTFFSDSNDGVGIDRWIRQWQERWESAETEGSLAHYRTCKLVLANRIVASDNNHQQFRRLLADGLEVDIAFLEGFINAGQTGNQFERVDCYDYTSRPLKFPVLEKPVCALKDLGKGKLRKRVLSNRQFLLASQHTEIMARIKSRQSDASLHHVILGVGDYEPWQGVVDELHQQAEWVVCIDPNIDERLIALKGNEPSSPRQIIGFGSGVGDHGEANYTISTEQFKWADVKQRLTASVAELFNGWNPADYPMVAASMLLESRRLSGLSLVRATTGSGEYIRDFFAYTLSRKLLKAEDTPLCDQLISLDAYRHWFDTAESDMRPDLLWMVVRIGQSGRLELDMHLIECKMAQQSIVHKEKAREQLKNGLEHLIAMFMPSVGDDRSKRPDERYWWLQLYRLIASKTETSPVYQLQILTALERLAEGDFMVQWRAALFAFWTDSDASVPEISRIWPLACPERMELGINVVEMGSRFVRDVCLEAKMRTDLCLWKGNSVNYAPDLHTGKTTPDMGCIEIEKKSDSVIPAHSHNFSREIERDNPEQINSNIEGKYPAVPERILLGASVTGDRSVYWEFGHHSLNNRHLLIFGSSGMGKTYGIQCILCELGMLGQNSLIMDYTDGFLPEQMEPITGKLLKPKQHIVRQSPLPISPFRLQKAVIDGSVILEKPPSAAKRIASIFQTVYELGDQQFSVLFDAITDGLETFGEGMSLERLMESLQNFCEDSTKNRSAVQTTLSKIKPFVLENPFGGDGLNWSNIFTDSINRCHVFQLATLDSHTRRLIVEFTLWDLYAFLQSQGSKDDPKVIVLDEIQNLDHKDNGPLSKFLREGRKFGISMIMATQIMSNLQKDERDRLFNAAHKLFFKPADTEVKIYAEIMANSTSEKIDVWIKRLTALRKGECYSFGPMLNDGNEQLEVKAFRIKITSLEERGQKWR